MEGREEKEVTGEKGKKVRTGREGEEGETRGGREVDEHVFIDVESVGLLSEVGSFD